MIYLIEIDRSCFECKTEITKDEFCTIVRDIQQYMKETAMIDNTLASIGDGNFSFFKADDLMFHNVLKLPDNLLLPVN